MYLGLLVITVFILERRKAVSQSPPLPDLPWSLWEVFSICIVIELAQGLMVGDIVAFSSSHVRKIGESLARPVALAGLCIFFFFSLGRQRTTRIFNLDHRFGNLQILFAVRCTLIYLIGILLLGVGMSGVESLSQRRHFQEVYHQWQRLGWSEFYLKLFGGVLAGSTLEEFTDRGLLYATMRKKISMWPALLIASLIFMLAHGNTRYGMFFIGAYFCLLLEKSRSLLPAIAAHISHNLIIHLLSLPLILSASPSVYLYCLGLGVVCILGIFWSEICLRKRRGLPVEWDMVWSVPR